MASFVVRVVDKAGETISEESFLGHHSALRVFRKLRKDLYGGVYNASDGAKVVLEKSTKPGKWVVDQVYKLTT